MIENNEDYFNNKLLPVFNNFLFSSYDPYRVPILPNKEDSDYFRSIFVQGCLFRQISFLENKKFDYKTYLPHYRKVEEKFINNEKFFFYKNIHLVKVSYYKDNDTIGELVYPLLKECIENDLRNTKK